MRCGSPAGRTGWICLAPRQCWTFNGSSARVYLTMREWVTMDRNFKKLAGAALVAALLGAACKGDPTTALVGSVSAVTTSLSYLTVNIGDSVLVQATVRDAANQPVVAAATEASSADAIATVSPGPGTPIPETQFYIKGVAYGTAVVTVTAGTATATINVKTYPAFVAITGSRDSVLSGNTRQLAATP